MESDKQPGRPSKYEPEMCAKVVDLMREGASKTEVCAEIDITFETLSQWTNTESTYFKQEFSDAVKTGERLSQAWWERLGREGSAEKAKINPAVWIFNMKNRFGWKDRLEAIGDPDKPIGLLVADAALLRGKLRQE